MNQKNILVALMLVIIIFANPIHSQQINKIHYYSDLEDIFFVDEEYGWVVGSNSTIIRTTNGGQIWKVITVPDNEIFNNIFFIDRNLGWITTKNTNKVYISYDGGEFWDHIYTLNGSGVDLMDIQFVNDSIGFLGRGTTYIYKTTDYGYNWEGLYGNYYESNTFNFMNEQFGWAGGVNRIYHTTNQGESWGHFDILTYYHTVIEISIFDQNNAFLITEGENLGGEYGNLFIATDFFGVTFSHQFFNNPWLTDIHFSAPNIGWLAGTKILKTIDRGNTWTILEPIVWRFDFEGEKSWGINNDNKILFSDDGWTTATIQFLFTVNLDDPLYIYDYDLYQNYPNPFNPTTKIKYQIPELSFITLKVYDVLGNEIATLVNEEKPIGNYEVNFDANNQPSGVYFYRLKAGSIVETKKMLLMK